MKINMPIKSKERLLSICREVGTPLYAYDKDMIRNQIEKLRFALPEGLQIYYSMKANPNLSVVTFINKYADGVEVSSEGELSTAMEAGTNPENIIFVGPGKIKAEIEYSLDESIGCIAAESERELEIIDEIAACKQINVNAVLRINAANELKNARIKMGGASKQFGVDEELVPEILGRCGKLKNVQIIGVHLYMGTQILSADVLVASFENNLKLARDCSKYMKSELKLIDFGGGFGIPYFKGEQELDMNVVKTGLQDLFSRNARHLKNIRMISESGRYIIAECGYFLTKVLYKKHSRGKTYLIVDGGSNFHSAAAGIGRFVRDNFPMTVLTEREGVPAEIVDVVGPLCTPTDVLAQNIELEYAEEGDIIAVFKSGAYGLSASNAGFLSHPKPAEVMFDEKGFHVVSEYGNRKDFIRGQKASLF